ncbi:glycosyltransferase family 4 protein [Candidatus Uhrbacteria bacterium]|nr:glycosyltransferase family 4 protein [Candidatus Uhrbacteria bacterium]
MSNPSIVLVTLEYPPDIGGIATYLRSLVEASAGGIEAVDAKKFFRSSWPRWWPMVKSITSIRSIVLVSHILPVGTAAWISRMIGGPEYAIIVHGTDVRRANTPWKRWLVRRICARARALVANSEATKRELLSLVPQETVHVVTPGVSGDPHPSRIDARRGLGLDTDEPVVLSVSRLVPRKGLDFSLRAISRIQTRRPVRYIVIGDGPDRERLEKVAAECRASVTWIRNATDEEKRRWYAAADVFLLPARDEGDDVEGFGIVYLESAMAGVPSVAGRSGGAVEAVRHENTGLAVNPDSIQEIAESVEKLLKDSELRRGMGENARRRVLSEFQWKDRWEKLKRILNP